MASSSITGQKQVPTYELTTNINEVVVGRTVCVIIVAVVSVVLVGCGFARTVVRVTPRNTKFQQTQTTHKNRNEAINWNHIPTFEEHPAPTAAQRCTTNHQHKKQQQRNAIVTIVIGPNFVEPCATTIASVWYTYGKKLPANTELAVISVNVSEKVYPLFERFGAVVWPQPEFAPADTPNTWNKFLFWKATQYSKIVTLDCDIIVQRPIHNLFDFPHAAQQRHSKYHRHVLGGWNSGVQVMEPNNQVFQQLRVAMQEISNANKSSEFFQLWTQWLKAAYKPRFGDQGVEAFLEEHDFIPKPVCDLGWWYNCMWKNREGVTKCFVAGIVHYLGHTKPWRVNISCNDHKHYGHQPPQSAFQPWCNVRRLIHKDFGDNVDIVLPTTHHRATLGFLERQ
eukprot:TRINITY_DN67866_c2_g2_i3.p2 TRINITY_DN67866_c2_g2~~TRINITY_DN67866_c2_g2_i3.p2  ORF type:complete len:395 (-),score=45.74 TRINITY_DN67866_c2_g2_i3:1553-2737(-)